MSRAADNLDRVVSAPAREVCETLRNAGHEAYVVGGAVRDALLGRDVDEWDVATDAHPDAVQQLFPRTVPTGIQHGTVTVLVGARHPRMPIEVTTFRGEGEYTDARRPDSVHFGVPLREDLARRDFVVNAMAYDPIDRRLEDPFGGRGDIDARVLRAVGDPAERFREDGLRVMRAVRFAAVLEFSIEPTTEAAIAGALPSLARVSAERVRVELLKLLGAREPARGLRIAARTGVLDTILPELSWDEALAERLAPMPRDPVLRLAALLAGLGKKAAASVCKRLRVSNDDRDRLVHAVGLVGFDYAASWTDTDVRRFVARAKRDAVGDVFEVRAAIEPDADLAELRARVQGVISAGDPLYVDELAISGQDVMRVLGVEPGRVVGQTLRALLDRVLDEPSLNERDKLEELVSGSHSSA